MGYVINFGKKRLEKFCSRQNSAAENIEERNLRIENLEIKVWIQNLKIKTQIKKVTKIRTHENQKKNQAKLCKKEKLCT